VSAERREAGTLLFVKAALAAIHGKRLKIWCIYRELQLLQLPLPEPFLGGG
jgi:hypothetical protein